jgi:hypothetical protein
MTILDNSLFQVTTILIFLTGLGALIISYLKRNYQYSAWGFGFLLLGFFQTTFLAILKGDFFVLSESIDYGANYLFSVCVLILAIVASVGLIMFLQHRIVPLMFIQLGILFSAILMLVTFGSSVTQSIAKTKAREKTESSEFIRSEDFQKGSPNPKWSKAGSLKDSLIAR